MSIPDYQSADSIYSRQRNLNNSNYRAARGISRPDSNYSSHKREPIARPTGFDSEEVRASFRSALTTNSSFLGTSGTERSSVMTKSSSATSIFGRDEGMSVDDAIGMYEGGFQDSGAEDNYAPRPSSEQGRASRLSEAMNDSLAVPSGPIIRNSTAIFGAGMTDTPSLGESSGQDGTPMDIQESYFDGPAPSRPTTRAATAQNDGTRDRYGFRKANTNFSLEKYEAWNGPYTEYLSRRRKKWVALLKDNGLVTDNPQRFPPQSAKVKRFVRKGIPPDWRGAAWFYYAGGPAMVSKHYGVYGDLIKKAAAGGVSETDDEIIERDLNRTFPDNIKFKPDSIPGNEAPGAETPMLQSLRRVLQAFSIYNPKIGYCQSLNFLAGLLLLFMDEEKSFWMLNIITRVYLPGTHEVNLEGANVDLGVLMSSIKDMMPQIWAKIGGELDGSAGDGKVSMRLPPITLCTTAWFMSCFIGTLPIETTLRVWDSFFYEGSKTLFRIALTIFKVGEQEIKAVSDPMEIFQVVQTIPRRLVDASALMEACFRRRNGFGHLSQETIEKGRAQRRKGYEEERARAAGGGGGVGTPGVGRKGTIFGRKKSRVEGV
jgi:TBC1 domain family member 6